MIVSAPTEIQFRTYREVWDLLDFTDKDEDIIIRQYSEDNNLNEKFVRDSLIVVQSYKETKLTSTLKVIDDLKFKVGIIDKVYFESVNDNLNVIFVLNETVKNFIKKPLIRVANNLFKDIVSIVKTSFERSDVLRMVSITIREVVEGHKLNVKTIYFKRGVVWKNPLASLFSDGQKPRPVLDLLMYVFTKYNEEK